MPTGEKLRTIVYVSCAEDKTVVTLQLDADRGTLSELARTQVPGTKETSPQSLPMALSPDHRFLYAGLRTPPFPVASYAIDPTTGGLTLIGTAHLADSMAYLATDLTGRWLFSASFFGSILAVNPIDPNGVAGDPVQRMATPEKAHSVLPDPTNRMVYAACLGGEAVLCQAFDPATGHLQQPANPVATTPPGSGPRHFAFARHGTLFYVINELGGSINTYARDVATGTLTELQSLSVWSPEPGGRVAAADIHLTPDERFLYGSDRTTNTLAAFHVQTDGTLMPIGTVPSEPTPRGFAIDPSGRVLLCAGLTSGKVGLYAIDAGNGTLRSTGAVTVGNGPNWIEMIRVPD